MRPSHKFLVPILFVIVLHGSSRAQSTAPAAAKSPPIELLAHGTDEMYWIARIEPAEGDTGTRRTSIQVRGNASERWRALGRLDGRAMSLANRGSELAVLLENGQWMLTWTGGGTLGQALPHGARLLGLAGDAQSLWAIGHGSVGPLRAMSGATTSPATSPATTQSTALIADVTALFEWEIREWVPRAILPDSIVINSPRDVSMALETGRPIIAARDRAGDVRVLRVDPEGRILPILHAGEEQKFKLIVTGTRRALWTSIGGPAGSIRTLDEPSEPKPLPAPDGLTDAQPSAVTSANGQLRLIYFRGNELSEQSYTLNGETAGEPSKLAKADAPNPETLPQELLLALLLILTFFVFAPAGKRRGDAIRPSGSALAIGVDDQEQAAAKKAVATAATPRVRLQAGVLDALPLIAVVFWVSMSSREAGEESLYEQAMAWRFYWGIASAIYFLHTTLGELFTGRTLGKAVFGLRVTTLEGQRPRPLAIVIRNIIRVLEVSLWPSLIVILFTPLHQRIGDMAARTVVVADDPPAEKESNDEASE